MKSGANMGTAKILVDKIFWDHAPPQYKHHWLCTLHCTEVNKFWEFSDW